jgi:hypothetical protein
VFVWVAWVVQYCRIRLYRFTIYYEFWLCSLTVYCILINSAHVDLSYCYFSVFVLYVCACVCACRSGYIEQHFLDLGTSWRWVVSFTPRPLYPRARDPSTHCIGGGWPPQPAWTTWRIENSWPYWGSNSDLSVVQPIASRYSDWLSMCVCIYTHTHGKCLLIRLQLILMLNNPDRNMENKRCWSQLSRYFKRHMAFRKADELFTCSDKSWLFLQTCIVTFKNKYNFWIFCRWINVLSFYSF